METSDNNNKSNLANPSEIRICKPVPFEEFLRACENCEISESIIQGIPRSVLDLGMHTVILKSQDSATAIQCLEILLSHGGSIDSKEGGNAFHDTAITVFRKHASASGHRKNGFLYYVMDTE